MTELFFELIRVALGSQERMSRVLTDKEWARMYQMACEQSLLGVCFYGLWQLQKQVQQPTWGIYYQWLANATQIQQRNETLNAYCAEVSSMFETAGFNSCILKGQGNASLYGKDLSLYRQPGDIDIWVEGKRKEIIKFLKQKGEIGDVVYHHVDFHILKDVEVEVHFKPSWMFSPLRNYRMQQWIKKQSSEQFQHDSGLGFNMPTWEFNVVYQLAHIFRHALTEGVGLRQLMDYYFLLLSAKDKLKIENGKLKIALRKLGLLKFAGAVMWVMLEVFHLEKEYLIVPVNEQEGRWLLNEVVQGGNFGRYNQVNPVTAKDGTWGSFIQKNKQNLRLLGKYPEEVLWAPVWRIWHFCWRKFEWWRI